MKDKHYKFQSASSDFLRLHTKDNLFSSKYLTVEKSILLKEKELRNESKSKIDIIKHIFKNFKDLNTIWNIFKDIIEIVQFVYEKAISKLDITYLGNMINTWSIEISGLGSSLYDIIDCKRIIDIINIEKEVLK